MRLWSGIGTSLVSVFSCFHSSLSLRLRVALDGSHKAARSYAHTETVVMVRSRHVAASQIAVYHSPVVGCTGHCVTLFFVGDLIRGGPRRAEVCNLCSLLKGNRSDFLLFWDDLEFCRIPQIPHDGIAVSYKFPVCATGTQVGTELREEVVVAYAVGLVSLTICPFVSLYPAEFCWDVFIAVGGSSVPLSYVGLGHCMFGRSVAYAERFSMRPRDRDPVLFVLYTLLLSV